MGKVSYLQPPPGLESAYAKGLQPGDRFQFSRIRVKDLFLSRARVKGVTLKSLLVSLAPAWASFSPTEQAAWSAAGVPSGLTGWKMFLTDTAARRRAALGGYATPNATYQSLVGRIEVQSPATGLQLEQAHPSTYYIQKKVAGTRSQYSPLAIYEPFSLPLSLSIAYKSDLSAAGSDPRARFYAVIYSKYQGRDIETELAIDFGLADSWNIKTASLSTVKGVVSGYSAFIEVYNAQGNLYFDNVAITHGAENWARDPHCNNIAESFTRAFFQVAKHWVAVNPSSGADFGSFYFVP